MSAKNMSSLRCVAMLLPSAPPRPVGGAELQALKLSAALAERGVNVFVVSEWGEGLPDSAESGGVRIFRPHGALNVLWRLLRAPLRLLRPRRPVSAARTDYSRAGADEKSGLALRRFGWASVPHACMFALNAYFFLRKRRGEFDVIHAHHAEWDGFVAVALARLLGKKALVKDSTVNGFKRLENDAFGRLMRSAMRRYAWFAAMTGAIAANLEEAGVPPDRILRLPNGVEVPELARAGREPLSCLFVGNLTQQPAKGLDVLLKAWPEVLRAFPGARLTVAGAGPAQEYERMAAQLGAGSSVRFLGRVEDAAPLYSAASVFALPSRREGMPNALLEAMARATPCVASAIPGMEEIVEDGKSGLLVPPDDPSALAAAITALFREPQRAASMGAAARRSVSERFSLEESARRYAEAYRRVIS